MSAVPFDLRAAVPADAFLMGRRSGALALVAANAGLLLLYLVADLTLFQLVVVYWWEAVWIGVFCALKLVVASVRGRPYDTRRIRVSGGTGIVLAVLSAVFFGAKYLVFVTILGVLIVLYSFEPVAAAQVLEVGREGGSALAAAAVLFLVGHGVSFVVNFLRRGEYASARAFGLVFSPYVRCLALLAAIAAAIAAARVVPALASTTSFGALVIALKSLADLALHVRGRRRPTRARPA